LFLEAVSVEHPAGVGLDGVECGDRVLAEHAVFHDQRGYWRFGVADEQRVVANAQPMMTLSWVFSRLSSRACRIGLQLANLRREVFGRADAGVALVFAIAVELPAFGAGDDVGFGLASRNPDVLS